VVAVTGERSANSRGAEIGSVSYLLTNILPRLPDVWTREVYSVHTTRPDLEHSRVHELSMSRITAPARRMPAFNPLNVGIRFQLSSPEAGDVALGLLQDGQRPFAVRQSTWWKAPHSQREAE
jgi:hypothetical protein